MGKVRYYLIIFLIMFFPFHGKSQKNTDVVRFCECQKVGTIIPPENKYEYENETIQGEAIYNQSDSTLQIRIVNNTHKPVYLFRSYFSDDICQSKLIYRYNEKSQHLTISFIPWIATLSMYYSDLIYTRNKLLYEGAVVYDFYYIGANSFFSFNLDVLNLKEIKKCVKDVNFDRYNKKAKLPKLRPVVIKKNNIQSCSVELAIYKDVSKICNVNSYMYYYSQFIPAAASYDVISIPIVMDGNRN